MTDYNEILNERSWRWNSYGWLIKAIKICKEGSPSLAIKYFSIAFDHYPTHLKVFTVVLG